MRWLKLVGNKKIISMERREEHNIDDLLNRVEKRRHTVASDGGGRGRREGPFGVSKFGRSEEGFDGFVGWARVTQTVKPQNKASRPRHGGGRGIWL